MERLSRHTFSTVIHTSLQAPFYIFTAQLWAEETETKVNLELFSLHFFKLAKCFQTVRACVCAGHLWRWTWYSKGWFADFQSKSPLQRDDKVQCFIYKWADCVFMHIPSTLHWQKSQKVLMNGFSYSSISKHWCLRPFIYRTGVSTFRTPQGF